MQYSVLTFLFLNMAKSTHYWIRKSHRYLRIIIGIQFLMWTLGGLYFSWVDMDEIHGDYLCADVSYFRADISLVSPEKGIAMLTEPVDSIHSIHLIKLLDKPYYRIRYFIHNGKEVKVTTSLVEAQTGVLREPLSESEAVRIAMKGASKMGSVARVEYLAQVDPHHEYREKPLPAYAIHFKDPSYTAYVGAETGTMESIRHRKWRIFDFLWMLHTMDYEGRDDFSNWLLKAFSIFGLFTVISGFALYFISSRRFRKRKRL